jgi:hypothetical protein
MYIRTFLHIFIYIHTKLGVDFSNIKYEIQCLELYQLLF